jgi:hypothetical protein
MAIVDPVWGPMECTIRPALEDDADEISAVILRALRETSAKDYANEIIERVERSTRKHNHEIQLYDFDILTLDGEDLRGRRGAKSGFWHPPVWFRAA